MTSPTARGRAERHIHFDPVGGMAGDMVIAALLDAEPSLLDGMRASIGAAGLPQGWRIDLVPHHDGVLGGSRFLVEPPDGADSPPSGRYADIRARLSASDLASGVRDRALDIFRVLAEAEAEIHRVRLDDVHFHELADWDSLADIVGAAYLIESMQPATWSCSELPKGGGFVQTAHGRLPVPAPAAALLLRGMRLYDDGIAGERVTPTGAAILRHLAPASGLPGDAVELCALGMGFGTRRLPGTSNVLRAMVFERAAATTEPGWRDELVAVLSFTVDDQTPEDLEAGLARVRATAGVIDLWQAAALGKKGRWSMRVEVLCRPEARDRAVAACLAQTTTLGVRWRLEHRAVLDRASGRVSVDGTAVSVKCASRPGGWTSVKAEHDDIVAATENQAERERLRRMAEGAAEQEADER